MAGEIIEFRNDIATSLFLLPCDLEELLDRDFLKTKSRYGTEMMIQQLENKDALFYKKDDVMHIKKEWAKENLSDRDLDFRTPKEIWIDSLSAFELALYKNGNIQYHK